ncbi:hypothetical protein [Paraburkholderia caledonica]|uniref:Uncharacterized protein n=1 Tax=Paraburkholderia caledonica TaxID=134536 RepID=A0AB73I9E2_9BURK|nr:hypothetical protein [Paraburkholderia caledonica]
MTLSGVSMCWVVEFAGFTDYAVRGLIDTQALEGSLPDSKRRSELLATGCRNAWPTSLRENLYGCTVSDGYFVTANREVFRSKEQSLGVDQAASLSMLEIATFEAKG